MKVHCDLGCCAGRKVKEREARVGAQRTGVMADPLGVARSKGNTENIKGPKPLTNMTAGRSPQDLQVQVPIAQLGKHKSRGPRKGQEVPVGRGVV